MDIKTKKEYEQYIDALNDKIALLTTENKELIECVESLLVLIDPRLELFDSENIGKGKSLIWNRVVKNAQNLINKQK